MSPPPQQVSSRNKRYHNTIIITRRSQGCITFGETYRLHLHLEYYHLDAVHGDGEVVVHPSCWVSPCSLVRLVPCFELVASLVVRLALASEGNVSQLVLLFGC